MSIKILPASLANKFSLRTWYKGRIGPGRRSPLELLMIQPTRFCNIDCSYCYLPLRHDKSRFDLDLIQPLFEKLRAGGLIDRDLTVLWHASEPLVLPARWYEEAFARIDEAVGSGVRISHNFQTNAMLISDDHCKLFKSRRVDVGVSFDGPATLHDARRKTRNGDGTHARAMAGVQKLKDSGIPFSAICVVTAESLMQPDAIHGFFTELGVFTYGLNVEEIEGTNATSSLSDEALEEAFKAFLRRLFELAASNPQGPSIREMNQFVQGAPVLFGASRPVNTESNPLSILSVGVEGNIATYSPEMLDLDAPDGRPFIFGNVRDVDFTRLFSNPAFTWQHEEIEAGIEACRQECGFFSVCGGGTPVNKLAENGSFNSTETLYCRYRWQLPLEVFEDMVIDQIALQKATRHRPSR